MKNFRAILSSIILITFSLSGYAADKVLPSEDVEKIRKGHAILSTCKIKFDLAWLKLVDELLDSNPELYYFKLNEIVRERVKCEEPFMRLK